jgi:hypothetical protein
MTLTAQVNAAKAKKRAARATLRALLAAKKKGGRSARSHVRIGERRGLLVESRKVIAVETDRADTASKLRPCPTPYPSSLAFPL